MFTLLAHYIEGDGYGNAAIRLAKALRSMGADLAQMDMCVEGEMEMIGKIEWTISGRVLLLAVPWYLPHVHADERFIFTMCEYSKLPPDFVEPINRYADAVIAPCKFCTDVFDAQTDAPVSTVPLGIDPDEYAFFERGERDRPYTFLWSGTPDARKGYDLAYRAFWAAFGNNPDVRLIMHFRALPKGLQGCRDANVELIGRPLAQAEWIDLLHRADCFVYPARGEGWGLPPREAAATGLPAIATNWGGLSEGLCEWGLLLSTSAFLPATFGRWEPGEIGYWAEPDFDHLVEWMRWCYENREAARIHARGAAAWLAENQTWMHSARALLDIMEG